MESLHSTPHAQGDSSERISTFSSFRSSVLYPKEFIVKPSIYKFTKWLTG